MGYFAMMDSVDTFVFYDDIQFGAQSWQSRNQIKTSSGAQWLSIPNTYHQGQKINEVLINHSTDWRTKHWKSIEQSYSKAPFFDEYGWAIWEVYETDWVYLSDFVIYFLRILAEGLDIKQPRFIKSSELQTSGSKTDRLIPILKELKADEYISGPAAKDYIEEDKFGDIKLTWFEYNHPIYPQIRGDFIPYMSVLDLLFNTGEEAIKYIREGTK